MAHNIGVALSGGGARGIAHLGILKVLEEHNARPTVISGTSGGAIVAAFYAAGKDALEVLDIIQRTKLYRYVRPAVNLRAFFKLDKLEYVYDKYLPGKRFEDLQTKLIIAATDIKRGRTQYFSQGDLIKPLIASSSLPVIFDPVQIDDAHYIDGGVLNNMPVEPLLGNCQKVMGLHSNPIQQEYEPKNVKSLLERSLLLAVNYNTWSRRKLCDVFMEPPELHKFGIFDFAKAQEIFDIGYAYAAKAIEEWPECQFIKEDAQA